MASKRSKLSRRSKRSKSADRISQLPDSLLLMILSLLPFQSAVRTSVLSKRWKPLYMSLPNLHIDDDEFRKRFGVDFINSIDRVLMNRPVDSSIQQFGLSCGRGYDPTRVNQWVHKALQHGVKDLSLGCYGSGARRYKLLPEIYTYGGFQNVTLRGNILINIPQRVSFATLKALRLTSVEFSNYELVEDLLFECPVLEDFTMEECGSRRGSWLAICGSALKNLMLTGTRRADKATKLEIVIDAPGLQTLEIRDSAGAKFTIDSTFLSLRTAHIDVGLDHFQYNESVFEILNNIYHVQCLALNDKAIGALDDVSGYSLPTFPNLIQLELLVDDSSCWNLLPNILASSPKLQRLLLTFGVDLINSCCEYYYNLWTPPKVVPECLSSHLEYIDFGMFHGTYDELSLIQYMLSEGEVLREISISCAEPSPKSRIRKEVMSFSRASKTCKIEYIK